MDQKRIVRRVPTRLREPERVLPSDEIENSKLPGSTPVADKTTKSPDNSKCSGNSTLLDDKNTKLSDNSKCHDKEEDNMCSICMERVITDFKSTGFIITDCNHKFHAKCYTRWLKVKSYYCPNCREPLLAPDEMPVKTDNFAPESGLGLNDEREVISFENFVNGLIIPSIRANIERQNYEQRQIHQRRQRINEPEPILPDRMFGDGERSDSEYSFESHRELTYLNPLPDLDTIQQLIFMGDQPKNVVIFEAINRELNIESLGISPEYSETLRRGFSYSGTSSGKLNISLDHYVLFTNYGMKGCSYIGNGTPKVCFNHPMNVENADILAYRCKQCAKKARTTITKYVKMNGDKLELKSS